MRNIFKILMMIAVVTFISNTAKSQTSKPFQGTITFDISYRGGITPAQKAQLPTVKVVTMKDSKSKEDISTSTYTSDEITDVTTKTEIIIIDYMGTKFSYKLSTEEITEGLAKNPAPTIKTTNDTKVIFGYTCKKAILTSKSENDSIISDTVYYTEQIGSKDVNFSSPYKDIPGTLLQYTEYDPRVEATVVYRAKEIKKSKVSDNVFLIPSDCKELTKEEFKKALGGE